MPNPDKRSKGRKHSGKREDVSTNIILYRYELSDFFDEDALDEILSIARQRIVRVFITETEPARGKMRRTDNYVSTAGTKPSELLRYVNAQTHRRVINRELMTDGPSLRGISKKLVDRLLFQLHHQAIAIELGAMQSAPLYEIYFNERHGIWQIVQSAVDQYYTQRDEARKATFKRDDRSFHGRNRSQHEARGLVPGLSVGLS